MKSFISLFLLLLFGGCNCPNCLNYFETVQAEIIDINDKDKVLKVDNRGFYLIEENRLSLIKNIDLNQSSLLSGSNNNFFYVKESNGVVQVDLEGMNKTLYRTLEAGETSIAHDRFIVYENNKTSFIYQNQTNNFSISLNTTKYLSLQTFSEVCQDEIVEIKVEHCNKFASATVWNEKDFICTFGAKNHSNVYSSNCCVVLFSYSELKDTWNFKFLSWEYLNTLKLTNNRYIYLKSPEYYRHVRDSRFDTTIIKLHENSSVVILDEDGEIELIEFDKIFTGHKLYKEIVYQLGQKAYEEFPAIYFSEKDIYVVYRKANSKLYTYEFYSGEVNSTKPTYTQDF